MKNTSITFGIFIFFAPVLFVLLESCETSPASPMVPVDTAVVIRQNLQPDSTIGWMYYSIDGDSLIPEDQAGVLSWDVRMAFLKCCGGSKQIDIQLNSGTVGTGTTKGAMVDSRFESFTQMLAGTTLRSDDTANPIVPLPVIGASVMFTYDFASHTIRPSPDRLLVLRTSRGRLVKFQITSIYKDAPLAPTQDSPIGYYSFRYANLQP